MMAWLRKIFGHTDPEAEHRLEDAATRNATSTQELRAALQRIDRQMGAGQ